MISVLADGSAEPSVFFFAQIAFFRGLNASELSQEIQNKLETVLTEC
jgi:hypothetical protein